MICKNCGAEYDNGSLSCPYCHTENRKAVLRRKKEILKGYDKEAEAMRKQAAGYVEQTANKITGRIMIILGIIAVLGILIAVISVIVTKYKVNHKYEMDTENKQVLEELLMEGNYSDMDVYMREKKVGIGYEKYDQIVRMYRHYQRIKEYDSYMRTTSVEFAKNRADWEVIVEFYVDDILDNSARAISIYENYGKDKEFLGNEKDLEEIYLWVVGEVEQYGFTEEDFSEIALEDNSVRCDEFHDIVLEYYWEMVK